MSKFEKVPSLEIGDNDDWITDGVLVYQSDCLGYDVVIPKGFVTDLASIPRGFRWLITVNGKHRKAAIVHDYLYALRGVIVGRNPLTRKECDVVFLEAMEVCDVNWPTRKTMYAAVRAGGMFCW